VKSATQLIVGTGGPLLLSLLPGGPISGPIYGAGIWASDAPVFGEIAAEAIYGPE
jgi:hypothetical protein